MTIRVAEKYDKVIKTFNLEHYIKKKVYRSGMAIQI